MDADIEKASEDYTVSLRELRAFRAEYKPVDLDDLFHLFGMWCYHKTKERLESEAYRRQQEEEQRRERVGE